MTIKSSNRFKLVECESYYKSYRLYKNANECKIKKYIYEMRTSILLAWMLMRILSTVAITLFEELKLVLNLGSLKDILHGIQRIYFVLNDFCITSYDCLNIYSIF